MIKCDIHDYVEIACIYRFEVEIFMLDNKRVRGYAKTIKLNEERRECLLLITSNSEKMIILSEVKYMRSLTNNPHFELINLNS